MAGVPPPSLSELMRMVAELQQANQIMAAQIAELNHVRIEHNGAHHQQPEDNEHHSQPSHVSETVQANEVQPEDEKEESDELVGPFTEEVMNFELPERFTLPLTFTPYDRLGDPKKFLKKFRSIMIVNGASDTVLCRCFPNYLDGPALDWLCALPAGSVSQFQQLAKLFEEHFAGSAIYLHDFDYLNTIKHGQNESLKDYMTRFTKSPSFNAKREDIIKEILNSKLIKPPRKVGTYQDTKNVDKSKYCAFHQKHGHTTDDCVIAKDHLERLARQGHLDKYIGSHIQKRSTPSRNEELSEQQHRGKEKATANSYEKPRGVINYISGGYAS
ncbi:uncharacterized protein [Arachis hypogaea]|uniref:uncharacterized protein n=1 Tax=Arachis hypogaea TaxID=3818 RepID=UPI003B22336D